MDLEILKHSAVKFLENNPGNDIAPEDAIREDLVGMRIYDAPVFGVGSASDPLFTAVKRPEVVGDAMLLPEEWLPDAKCVISWFLPFTETVRQRNAADMSWPSDEWLHGRFEGQLMNVQLADYICSLLEAAGFQAVAPMKDERYIADPAHFMSNWSERHVAYICGLGTFGMHASLITEKGTAGRLGSVITNAELPVTERNYSGPFEYCIRCGACAVHCPADAIDPAMPMGHTKSLPKCARFLSGVMQAPPKGKSMRKRYGCGKCLVGVPCAGKRPEKP